MSSATERFRNVFRSIYEIKEIVGKVRTWARKLDGLFNYWLVIMNHSSAAECFCPYEFQIDPISNVFE